MLTVVGLLSAGQMKLQGVRDDPGFFELLRRAGCRGEAFDLVAVLFGGCADGCE